MTFSGENLACIRGERLVFERVGFTLAPGDALLLQGPNGSGKSSLLRLCAGLLKPALGRLTWFGADIAEDPEAHHARLQYVGHLDAVKPAFSVADNLTFWARLRGGSAAAAAALDAFGLAELATLPARYLSAGQRRRLNLARLLTSDAAVLWLLDEPTTSLDRAASETLAQVIEQHRRAGGMVIAATHLDLGLGGAARLDLQDFAVAA